MLFFLSSCSFLNFKREVVSIDSSPRGIKVFGKRDKKSEEYLGTTPLFYKIKVNSSPQFFFEYENGEPILSSSNRLGPYQLHEECGMSWTDPLVNKIPIVNKLIPEFLKNIFPGYNPLNLSGGRYECYKRLVLDLGEHELEVEKIIVDEDVACRKFVIIPPAHPYKRASDKLIKDWIEKDYKRFQNSCDELVSFKESEVYLSFLGIDNLSRREGMKHLSYKKLSQIGLKFKATHLIYLSYVKDDGEYSVTPEIYDVHSRKRINDSLTSHYESKITVGKSFKLFEQMSKIFKIIPNSAAIKIPVEKRISILDQYGKRLPDRKSSLFSSFPTVRIGNIDYPYREWGGNFRFSPSLSYKHWNQEYNLDFMNLMMALKMNIHTSLGAIRFRYAYGVSRFSFENERYGVDYDGYTDVIQYGVGHFFFITKRTYIMTGLTWSSVGKDKFRHRNFAFDHYREIYIRFGYFVPEMKMKIRSFFHD